MTTVESAEKVTFPKRAVEIVGVGLAVSGQDRIPCVAEGHRMVTVPVSVLLFRIVFHRALTRDHTLDEKPHCEYSLFPPDLLRVGLSTRTAPDDKDPCSNCQGNYSDSEYQSGTEALISCEVL